MLLFISNSVLSFNYERRFALFPPSPFLYFHPYTQTCTHIHTDHPPGATPTLPAFTQMLREQHVGLVLQIDPHAFASPSSSKTTGDLAAEGEELHALLRTTSKRGCGVWPADPTHVPPASVVDWDAEQALVTFEYPVEEDGTALVRHHWFYAWRDFTVPGPEADGAVLALAEEAVATLRCVCVFDWLIGAVLVHSRGEMYA